MKTISIITPCYNEEENVREVYHRVRAVMAGFPYRYEHIFIDNASQDRTLEILKEIAAGDRNVKVIANTRNFGHIRSPFHAFNQACGDAVTGVVSDLQDPPEMIGNMIRAWENGAKVVVCIKKTSGENSLVFWVRKRYYRLVNRLSQIETYENYTGFGLLDRQVVDMIKQFEDPYPYFRGMVAEIGLPHVELYYDQPARKRGITKNNFYTLYDMAILGITNLSKVPLRVVTFSGLLLSLLSALVGFGYLIYKLLFWNRFSAGIAPLTIGIFFFASLQLFFLGVVGEYIGAIHTLVQKRPLVFEKERINFEYGPGEPIQTASATGDPKEV